MLTDTDLALIRDEVGTTPDDGTLYEWHDELGHWIPVAIRALKRRLADGTAGGQTVSSFSLDGVMSVGLGRTEVAALSAQIAALEARWAVLQGHPDPNRATTGRLARPDRYR